MQTAGDCQQVQCNGSGATMSVALNTDTPMASNQCNAGICDAGAPDQDPLASGTACNEAGGTVCSGAGACVECVSPAQCGGNACVLNVCQAASCSDGLENGSETDIDCGGGGCPDCEIGEDCLIDSDCETNNCTTTCQPVAIDAITPSDGATVVTVSGATIAITFSGPMTPASLTLKTALDAGACTGTIQVSTDDFTTCIPMTTATPAMSGGNAIATLTPAPGLSLGSTYDIRVTTGALDAQGDPIGALFTTATGFTTATDPANVGAGVVISQVYGAGGNSGALFTNDFIELHNRSGVSVDISTWSVQYASATGASWAATNLTGSIPAGGYYLVQASSGGASGAPLPTPDVVGTLNMAGGSGKVALVSSTTLLAGTCPADPTLVDIVGYGPTANCFEGAAPVGVLSATTAGVRSGAGCVDTQSNGANFTVATPTPRNSASAAALCTPTVANESGAAGEADFCNVQSPASLTVQTGVATGDVFGQIFELGVTEGAGAGAGILAEFGYGPRTANPEHQAGWIWTVAAHNAAVTGNNDEYQANITAPAVGSYSYAFRFSRDGGLTYTYCDVNGAGSNAGLSFETTRLPLFTVTP
jgi:hypothetical protein